MVAVTGPRSQGCERCRDAIELDQVAVVRFENDAEIAVIACDEHLRRLVLAMEVHAAFETAHRLTIPPLIDLVFAERVPVQPERRAV